jgi:tetratricopeptide (TPR) repeat protein
MLEKFEARKHLYKQYFIFTLALLFIVLSYKTFLQCNVWENSVTLWTHIIKKSPNEEAAYTYRGNAYAKQGKYTLALYDLNKALEINPNYHQAYVNRGVTFTKMRKFALAFADYNKALEIKPNKVAYYNARGIAYREAGRFDLALDDFNKALSIDPNISFLYFNRSLVFFDKKEYKKALKGALKAQQLGHIVKAEYIEYLKEKISEGTK